MDIDCKYHWKKAQWGVLGNEKTPAGIVYMDITFKQPKDYWLKQGNVLITLSDDSPSEPRSAPRRPSDMAIRPLSSDYAVQLTNHYGPQLLTGTKTILAKTKHNKFVPTVGAMGFEMGGVGCESATVKHSAGRWVFKGTLGTPKGGDGLRTLEWELSENDVNPEQVHNQTYQTAFAFEHSMRPVFMRVEVKGKLLGRRHQMKHAVLRFSSTFAKKDDSTLTELDLGRTVEFTSSLDHVAQGLDMAMQMANCERLPVEVPDPTPAHFIPEITLESPLGQTQRLPRRQPPAYEQGNVQESVERLELQQHECKYVQDCEADPVTASLRRQLRDRAGSDVATCIHEEEARRDSETTNEDTVAVNSKSTPVEAVTSPVEAIDPSVLDIVKIPGLLMLLKLIATMMQWLSSSQRVLPDPTQDVTPGSAGHELVDHARLLGESLSRTTVQRQLAKLVEPLSSPPAMAVGE